MNAKARGIVIVVLVGVFLLTLHSSSLFVVFLNWSSLVVTVAVVGVALASRLHPQGAFHWQIVAAVIVFTFIWARSTGLLDESPLAKQAAIGLRSIRSSPLTFTTIDELRLKKRLLPKDYLLIEADKSFGDYAVALRACHIALHHEMTKFDEWELIEVRRPFPTSAPRGRAIVIGMVTTTKKNEHQTVWDQTWFFRDGQLIADFDTSEFGKLGAEWWCGEQEMIQRVYGGQ